MEERMESLIRAGSDVKPLLPGFSRWGGFLRFGSQENKSVPFFVPNKRRE
jgi:hypothetical protein